MRNNFWDKRIPTLLGFFLILIGIGITSLLVQRGVIYIGRASPIETPLAVRITNISDTSFSVSYTTATDLPGTLSFGKDQTTSQVGLDDKDEKLGTVTAYSTHHITVHGLTPQTKYFFSILSGKSTFLNGEVPFQLTTAPTLVSNPPTQQPISGKVSMPNGDVAADAIVYVTLDKAQTISELVKSNGTYLLPLNSIRTEDLSSYFTIPQDSIIRLLIVKGDLESHVKISKNQINPIPTIILSKDYDFTLTNQEQTPSNRGAQQASSSAEISFPSFKASEKNVKSDPQILSPKKDEKFTDQQPLFSGNANPSETVFITIESSNKIQTQVTADSSGTWSFRPQTPLGAGQHTITIKTKDRFGIIKTLTQSFTVFAQGSQVTESATPSATSVPTVTLTPTVTPIPNLTPTVTPLLSPSPTPTITIAPTPTPTQKVTTPKGGAQSSLPPTGSSMVTIGITAFLTTIGGVLLFVLTRGASHL